MRHQAMLPLLAVAALGLAACGSSGSDSPAATPTPPTGGGGGGGGNPPAPTNFATFAKSILDDAETGEPRDINDLEFDIGEEPDQFDDVF